MLRLEFLSPTKYFKNANNKHWLFTNYDSIAGAAHLRKALHYAARKFYAPVAMGLFLDKNCLTVNVSNETMNEFGGTVRIVHSDANFNEICSYTRKIKITSLTSSDVFSQELVPTDKYSQYIYAELYDNKGNFVMKQTELFVPSKHFEWKNPGIKTRISVCDGETVIDIKADAFAKGVYIDFENFDCKILDNFFDVTDKNTYRIKVETDRTPKELEANIKIMSVYDIG